MTTIITVTIAIFFFRGNKDFITKELKSKVWKMYTQLVYFKATN